MQDAEATALAYKHMTESDANSVRTLQACRMKDLQAASTQLFNCDPAGNAYSSQTKQAKFMLTRRQPAFSYTKIKSVSCTKSEWRDITDDLYRGKKAKRKSREKQLEEARRLASLQKKREMQAAGIELRQKASRRRGINYNNEVAFEKRPAIGFFDTAEENQRSKEVGEVFRPQTLEELEGKRRKVGMCCGIQSLTG